MQCARHPWITLQGSVWGQQYCPECAHEAELAQNARNAAESMELMLESQRQLEQIQRDEAYRAEEQRRYQEELSFLREGLPEFDEPFQDVWAHVNIELEKAHADTTRFRNKNKELNDKYMPLMEYFTKRFVEIASEAKMDDYISDSIQVPGDSSQVKALSECKSHVDSSVRHPVSRIATSLAAISSKSRSQNILEEAKRVSAAVPVIGVSILCLGGLCACLRSAALSLPFLFIGGGICLISFFDLIWVSTENSKRSKLLTEFSDYIRKTKEAFRFNIKLSENPETSSSQLLERLCWALSEPFAQALKRKGEPRAQEYFDLNKEMNELIPVAEAREIEERGLRERFNYLKQEIISVGKAIVEGRRVKGRRIHLNRCPSCAGPVSSEDKTCPYCGSHFK